MGGGAGIGVGVSLPPHLLGVESAFSQLVRLVTSLLLRGTHPLQPLLQHPDLGGILPPITCDPRKEHSMGSGNLCGDTSSVGPLVSELLSGPLLPCSPPS